MRRPLFIISFVLLMALPALAQEAPNLEVAAGYAFLRDEEIKQNFHGGVVSAVLNVNKAFGFVGDVGANYKTIQGLGLNVYSFLAGPRFISRQNPKVTPFSQILLGGVRASVSFLG